MKNIFMEFRFFICSTYSNMIIFLLFMPVKMTIVQWWNMTFISVMMIMLRLSFMLNMVRGMMPFWQVSFFW